MVTSGGAPIDRSQRQGSPVLLMLLAVAVVGAIAAMMLADEQQHAFYFVIFLSVFAAIGVLTAFLYAAGFLQFAGRAARNDITKAIVDSDSEGVLVVDREGRVLYANAAYQALCGAAGGKNAAIRPVERLLSGSPEVSEATYRLAQAAREGRKTSEVMRLVPALSGDAPFAWYRVSVRTLARADGVAQYWTVQDVTRERERNENEFQELQQAISYLDNAPAGFFCARPDGLLSYMNATLAQWLDLDIAEVAEKPVNLADITAGQGASLVQAISGRPGEIRTETIDLDLKRRGGQTLPVRLLHHIAFAADGTKGTSRTLVLNRSQGQDGGADAGRAAEVRFARFFNNSPLAIATLARDGTVLSSNARFASLLPHGTGPGLRLPSLIGAADQPKVEAAFNDALAGRSEIPPVDAALTLEGNRSARLIFVPAETRGGEGEAVLAYLIETTEEKKLQEQFFQSMKMNAIGQLAGGVAHDFNNHLQAILGFADLLIGNYRATDPRHQDVMQIKYSANRAKALVRQLLAFSRQQTLLPEAIDLGEQLSDLTNMLKRSIGPKVDLEVRHGRDLWGIYADPASFDNMVLNLAVNARDAMPDGGRLTVRTTNVRAAECEAYHVEGMKPADYVLIEVADTGTGMLDEVRKKIFEPFFTTKEVGRGTGLGLSSVYGFISQSNGYIDCQSEQGKGTVFRIFLPRHDVPVIDLPAPPVAAAPAPAIEAEGTAPLPASDGAAPAAPIADHTGKGTILLVEDEDAVRAFGSRALRSRGYTIIEAQSGVDALEQVGNRIDDIDLVVSDVVMPEMDGPTLLKELRARNPELRVIFVSGYAEEAFRKNLPEGQQFDFLPKPFGLKQLVEKVKEVMG